MAKPTAQIHIVGPHTLFKSLAHLEASIPMRWNPSMLFFGGRIASNDLPCRGFCLVFPLFLGAQLRQKIPIHSQRLGRSLPLSPPSFRQLHLKRVYRFGLPRCNSGDVGMKQFADGI
jgi:hypothetical protein